MNLAFHIYNFLQENGTELCIPNFGVFSIEKRHAVVDSQTGKILPPNSIINFSRNEHIANDHILVNFVAQATGSETYLVQTEIDKIIQQWNYQLQSNHELVLEHLGIISVSQEIEYSFYPSQDNISKFFGLEPISIQRNIQKDSTLKNTILWGFLVILPTLALIYLGYQNQDLILGKKSFENTKRIKETPKKDSIIIDSIMIENDTLQVITENENITIR